MKEKKTTPKWKQILAIPLYLLALLGPDLCFQRLYGQVGGGSWPNLTATAFTLLWALFLGALLLLLPRLAGRIMIVVTVLLSVILISTHAVMYHLFGNFFGFPDLLYASDGAAFFSFQYLHMRKLLLASILLALACGVFSAAWLPKMAWTKKRIIPAALAAVLCVSGLLLLDHSMKGEYRLDDEMRWDTALNAQTQQGDHARQLYAEFKNPNACLPLTGLYQYTWRDFTKTFLSSASKEATAAVKQLDDWYGKRPAHEQNEYTGKLADKNVIMVMVESLDSWLLDERYMPNLYALAQKSVRLDHFYTPLYLNAGTFATEFTAQTGVIPPISGVSTDAYVTNALPAALPRLFAAKGYTVNSFHSAGAAIYNRGAIHRNLGFEAYHSYLEMGMDDYMIDTQMLNGFDSMVNREQPFYSFVITYSGHGPYTSDFDNIAMPHLERAREAVAASGVTASADTMEQYTRAVAQLMETDDFFGGLLEKLEDAGLLDDTVLIVFGDHYCKYLTDTNFLLSMKGAANRNLLCNTPFLIYSKELEPGSVEKYASTVDVYPTVCNLFGLDADLRYFAGDDLFSEGGGLVYWRDGCVYDGQSYLDSTQFSSMTDRQKEICTQIHNKLDMSWKTFQYDYFRTRIPLAE